ncbi:MAG: 3-phosphoshikimate 1-carboxyvinyltransferase [Spirochaetaceae bacterium]|nr:3-phosphoshikimate 1-carboxyvinyltransferase [Spirochaetaceae bacterium]
MTRSLGPSRVGGELRAPASKSSMQRALACALLAQGTTTIRNPSWCADSIAAASIAESLGARIVRHGDSVAIEGGLDRASAGARRLDCGESGLCMRMFSPIAALLPGETELGGRGSLLERKVSMVESPLRELGAACSTRDGLPPVRVTGPLRGGRASVDGRESSQLLTGLLLALPLAPLDSVLEVQGIASRGYIDLTLDTMRAFGVDASRDEFFREFRVSGNGSYSPADFEVEGDWSGAAFLLVAGALAAKDWPLTVTGLQAASSQPDRAIMEVLRMAGAGVEPGPGSVAVRRDRLGSFEFDATDCPDLFPPLVALAAACEGESRIAGASRLRGKESDRALALSEEFGALGIEILVRGDLMIVRGGDVQGGSVSSRNDHRIAMACAIASLVAQGEVSLEGTECVAKSWPGFFEDLEAIKLG